MCKKRKVKKRETDLLLIRIFVFELSLTRANQTMAHCLNMCASFKVQKKMTVFDLFHRRMMRVIPTPSHNKQWAVDYDLNQEAYLLGQTSKKVSSSEEIQDQVELPFCLEGYTNT